MELSNSVIDDKKESLHLNVAKANLDIVENTHSKPPETLEFEQTKQKEIFYSIILWSFLKNGWRDSQV